MEYTEWIINGSQTGPTTPIVPSPVCGGEDWGYETVNSGFETIAICPNQDSQRTINSKSQIPRSGLANAHLIAAAVNACIKLNPNNPMAVAESIGELYEACKDAVDYFHDEIVTEFMKTGRVPYFQSLKDLVLAIAKAEGK